MLQAVSHPVKIQAPHYAQGAGVALHKYLDTEFLPRFQQDLSRQRLDAAEATAWLMEDRFSPHDDSLVLRLPIHRCFHLVSCEVVCDVLGGPALDPRRITSAGFVIRHVGAARERAWMLVDGEARGWEPVTGEARDPDLYRRLCANGVLRARDFAPAYTGEETHPLHVLKTRDGNGRARTLLHGFVPLGGFYYARVPAGQTPFDAASEQQLREAAGTQLPWPYGYRTPLDRTWTDEHGRPISRGVPSKGMFELLRVLAGRYHLGEPGIPENEALEALARQIHFYDARARRWRLDAVQFDDVSRGAFRSFAQYSLWDYLESCAKAKGGNPLVSWIARQEKDIDAAGGLDAMANLAPLPPRPLEGEVGDGEMGYSLYMSPADAQELRELLGERVIQLAAAKAREIPLPKFGQGVEDLYQILPFVRYEDESGRERITWVGREERSERFRVASAFDPEASRPSLIQMPGLADLRRGLAKGASVLMPPDTFNLIDALKLGKGASEDAVPEEAPGPGLGLQWICSFSLPVITLVAMILLMIMISLLNIVFFWLPWVRICLPFPKLK